MMMMMMHRCVISNTFFYSCLYTQSVEMQINEDTQIETGSSARQRQRERERAQGQERVQLASV